MELFNEELEQIFADLNKRLDDAFNRIFKIKKQYMEIEDEADN